jgi:hypothetical protein
MSTEKVPKNAAIFASQGKFEFLGEEENKKFNMLAYSGGIIQNHWYWGNLAIDLQGLKFEKEEYPILIDHDTNKKLGVSNKPAIGNGLQFVEGENFRFVDTEDSQEFKKLALQGWPYQASIYALPTKVKRLEENEEMEVNGYTLKGPNATVWMEATYMESSVATFGYDRNTKTGMFSGDAEDLYIDVLDSTKLAKTETTEDGKKMDLNKFKTENPDLFSQLQKEVEQSVKDMFAADIKELTEKLKTQGDQLLQFEKMEAIRRENEIALEAKAVWAEKLSQSEIAERLHSKVKRQVSHEGFVKDGKLDVEAFSAAIAAEITDWESLGVSQSVLGMGTSLRHENKTEAMAQDSDSRVENLLKLVK